MRRGLDSKAFLDDLWSFVRLLGAQESMNKSAASAASLDHVNLQAVNKSAASAASPKDPSAGPLPGRSRLTHGSPFAIFGRASGQILQTNVKHIQKVQEKRFISRKFQIQEQYEEWI